MTSSRSTTEAGRVLRPDGDDPDWSDFCTALYWLLGPVLPGRCDGSTTLARMLLGARGYDPDASPSSTARAAATATARSVQHRVERHARRRREGGRR